jgi:flagellar biosynthesis protein FliQ
MQEDAALLALADQTLWVTALIAGPVLIAALVVVTLALAVATVLQIQSVLA